MAATLHDRLAKLLAKHPYGSQSENPDPLVVAKLFDACWSATWWVTEYDLEDRVIFCFVTGLFEDEWGSASVDELAALKWGPMPRVEIDLHFEAAPMSAVRARYGSYFRDSGS